MASIGKYRKKIKSAKNIAKITKAMQLVAASKMKKAQNMALSGKEYSDGISNLTSILSRYMDKSLHPLIRNSVNSGSGRLVVLIAPEKGLCGSLVTNLGRYIRRLITSEQKRVEAVVVGNKAKQIAARLNLQVVAQFPLGLSYPTFDLAVPIARFIEEKFISGSFGSIDVVYAEFINTMFQEAKHETLLPLDVASNGSENMVQKQKGQYVFEPTASDIVNSLLKMYLETKIYHILLEAYASEQSARMVAMKGATDNAKSLIGDLTLEFNKVRQSVITSEILDIGNAAMAVS